jgi:hypothetical protein
MSLFVDNICEGKLAGRNKIVQHFSIKWPYSSQIDIAVLAENAHPF